MTGCHESVLLEFTLGRSVAVMKVEVKVGNIADWKDEAIVVNLFEGVKKTGGATRAVDRAMGGAISKVIAAGDFQGKFKQVTIFPTLGKIPAKRVMIVGLGKKSEFSLDRIREVSGKASLESRQLGISSFSTIVHGAGIGGCDFSDATEAVTEGALLALYRFSRYKTKEEENKEPKKMTIITNESRQVLAMREAINAATIIASSTNIVKDLVNIPGNEKPPRKLAQMSVSIAKEAGVKCQVLDEKIISKLGMNALIAVGKGSDEPPRFLILEYKGSKHGKPIVFVGKGITFDTGGISLKPQESPIGPMWEMRHDMTGMATVLAVVYAAAKLKLSLNIVGLAPMAENMPSGSAQRPGDIIKGYSGKTIEVLNTDAEGRLILADALAYAEKWNPQAVIDIATLTGAAIIALGRKVTPILGNDSDLIKHIEKAAEKTGERVWQLPLFDEYAEQLKSSLADIVNTGGRSAGTITAAMFLKHFIGEIPWVHIDIAGTCWVHGGPESIDKTYMPKGPSGICVRLLIKGLRDWGKSA